jgi:hypothetical protein
MRLEWKFVGKALPPARFGPASSEPMVSADVLGWWEEGSYHVCNYDHETETWHVGPDLEAADVAPVYWAELPESPHAAEEQGAPNGRR